MTNRPVSLEEQVLTLAEFGLPLAPGRSVDDLITMAGSREHLESQPYLELLSVVGSAQAERSITVLPGVASIDLEFVEDDHSYPAVVRLIASTAGAINRLEAVRSNLDTESEECTLTLSFEGRTHTYHPDVQGDWGDGLTLCEIAELLSLPGQDVATFYPDGALGLAWVPRERAEELESFLNQYS